MLYRRFKDKDLEFVRTFVLRRFDVEIDADTAGKVRDRVTPDLQRGPLPAVGDELADSTMADRVKTALLSMGFLRAGEIEPPPIYFFALLHCFPLNYEPTPDMCRRLHNEPVRNLVNVARSKLFAANQKEVRPVDRTAFGVAPPPRPSRQATDPSQTQG